MTRQLTAVCALVLFLFVIFSAQDCSAALIWGLTATTQSANGATPSNTTVTRTQDPNVNGTDGAGYGASAVGLSGTFDTAAAGTGNIYIRHATTAGNTAINFATGYTEFTIAANPGYVMNLTNLTWASGRGGTTGVRGFELYGVAGGTPTISDLLLNVDAETGTRTAPVTRLADLTGAAFQGITSVTFRYYPLTDDSGRSIEMANLRLNGTVAAIPEPSSLGLGLLGAFGLAVYTRRQSGVSSLK